MQFQETSYNTMSLILKRPGFEAIPIVVDSNLVGEGKTVKAGTPLNAAGAIANDSTAVGILLHDVVGEDPNGALLKKAYVSNAKVTESYGTEISAAAKAVLPMIIFE